MDGLAEGAIRVARASSSLVMARAITSNAISNGRQLSHATMGGAENDMLNNNGGELIGLVDCEQC